MSISLIIKNPHYPEMLFQSETQAALTIADVKQLLCARYLHHPSVSSQRLLSEGRLLRDEETLQQISSTKQGDQTAKQVILYLALKEQPQQRQAHTNSNSNNDSALNTGSSSLYHHQSYTFIPYSPFVHPQPQHQQSQQQQQQLAALYAQRLYNNWQQQGGIGATTLTAGPTAAAGTTSASTASSLSVVILSANGPVPVVATAPVVVPPSRFSLFYSSIRRYVDVRLLLKLCLLLLVFSRQGDAYRSMMLMIAAIVAYLWQVGAFRQREQRDQQQQQQAAPQPVDQQQQAAADADMEQVRRQAREERLGAAAARPQQYNNHHPQGGGAAHEHLDDEDEEEDIQLQREQLLMLQQQHQAELIRRGALTQNTGQQGNSGENNTNDPNALIDAGWLITIEKFIVGFFASLVPTWRPTMTITA